MILPASCIYPLGGTVAGVSPPARWRDAYRGSRVTRLKQLEHEYAILEYLSKPALQIASRWKVMLILPSPLASDTMQTAPAPRTSGAEIDDTVCRFTGVHGTRMLSSHRSHLDTF